ncbi:MAG: 30S ribosomal protein S11, partial [Firmicutes bacterium]|nr:30S ribosomal protein S11 [Bacillota bacterium]
MATKQQQGRRKSATAARPKRRDRKNVEAGVAHIRSTFNNTIVT